MYLYRYFIGSCKLDWGCWPTSINVFRFRFPSVLPDVSVCLLSLSLSLSLPVPSRSLSLSSAQLRLFQFYSELRQARRSLEAGEEESEKLANLGVDGMGTLGKGWGWEWGVGWRWRWVGGWG